MTQDYLLLRGMVIGFALAAPVGPVGVLCIRRALLDGRHAAFIAGLGAALADTLFGAVAGLGLTVISSFLLSHQALIRLVGGFFLIAIGLRGWNRKPCVETGEGGKGPGLAKDFVSTFMLALTNPATILAAVPVVAAVGAKGLHDAAGGGELILGVFLGSTLWWLVLSAVAGAIRSRFSPQLLTLLNRLSGAMLTLTGGVILISLVFYYFDR
jgi:threonine/homoserine/homoserine lactone efflux protein